MAALSEMRKRVIIEGQERGVKQTTESVVALNRAHTELGRNVEMQMRVMRLEEAERQRMAEAYRAQTRALREMQDGARNAANSNSEAFKNIAEGSVAIGKMTASIGAAYVAWRGWSVLMTTAKIGSGVFLGLKILNPFLEEGTRLLEKYANAQRALDRSDLASNMAELTRFQNDMVPAVQVQRATELGNRLADAKFQISEFAKVQLDLTKPALELQAIWVKIVEVIADAVRNADRLAQLRKDQEAKGEIISFRPGAIPLKVTPPAEPTLDESMGAARNNLRAGLAARNVGTGGPLGTDFNAQFNDRLWLIKNYKDETKEATKATTEARDAWTRATESLSKHIATMEADARAVGQGVEAQARLRAEAQLMEAGLRAGMTPEVIKASEAYKTLTQRAGEAAVALERARIRDRIGFERDTMFLPDSERQIASQLRGLYPDINAGLASTEAAQMRVNQRMMEMRDIGMDFARGFGSDMLNSLRNGEKASQAFTNAMMNGLNRIADKLMQMAMENLFLKAFGGGSGSGAGAGGFLSLFGGGGSDGGAYVFGGQAVPFGGASSAYMMGGTAVPVFHRGGMVGLNGEMRWVHPSYFDNAPRAHTGARINWAAGERPIIAQTGERILSRSQNAEYERGGRRNQVIINNYGAQIEHRQNDNGDEEITVRALVRDELASPRTNPIFRAKNGISPRQVRRA